MYSKIEGDRKGTEYYVHKNYLFKKNKIVKGVTYLKCREASCQCTAQLDVIGFKTFLEHNHLAEEREVSILKIKSLLKKRAETETVGLREIFDQVTTASPFGHYVTFAEVENAMYLRRRSAQPKIPENAVEASVAIELSCQLNKIDGLPFYRKTVHSNDTDLALLFMPEKMVDTLQNVKSGHVDGTFKVVPKQFTQLVTIFGDYKGHVLPLFHVLMTNKTQALYEKVFEGIKDMFPQFSPDAFMSDFETGLMNAIQKSFDCLSITGCLFHFDQSLYRRVGKLGLIKEYRINEDFKKWIGLFVALSRLPATEITVYIQKLEPVVYFQTAFFPMHSKTFMIIL